MVDLRDKTFCKRHPQTESYLGCSRCGDLICSECLIQTPVGARCPDHASEMRNPMTQASGGEMTRALIVAGVVSLVSYAVVFGVVSLLDSRFLSILIGTLAPIGIGVITGEAVFRASGYTRNRTLAWIAAGAVAIGLWVALATVSITFGLFIGMYLAYKRVSP